MRKRRPLQTRKGSHAGEPSPRKGRRFPPEVLSEDEATGLLRACSTRAATGMRNRALIVMLWRTGLRLAEALALKASDIDAEGVVRVLHGKGDKARTVALDPLGHDVVKRWADKRSALGIRSRYLFCTLDGRPLQRSYVGALIPRLATKAGIDKRVTPHTLRHTIATDMARRGRPLVFISAVLGHSNVATTNRYLAGLLPAEVVQGMREASWKL
jgi:site-specific recombinase XerD